MKSEVSRLRRKLAKSGEFTLGARCEHEDGYELTAIPVVAFLMRYVRIRKPGLHMMGPLAEPNQLIQDMESMGVKIATSIESS